MANTLEAGGRGVAERSNPHNLIFKEIVPSSGWTEDSDCRCLIIDLPGFRKEEVKVQVDDHGHLLVSGQRQVNEIKHVRFEQSYKVPDNSNIEETTAKFEDDILYIIIPKIPTADKDNDREEEKAEADHHVQEEDQLNALDRNEVLDEAKVDSQQRIEEGTGEKENEENKENFHDARIGNQWNERSLLGTLQLQLNKNKGILVTAVLAFSLGVLVSQKFQANQEE